jgi:hypothetical protein
MKEKLSPTAFASHRSNRGIGHYSTKFYDSKKSLMNESPFDNVNGAYIPSTTSILQTDRHSSTMFNKDINKRKEEEYRKHQLRKMRSSIPNKLKNKSQI